MQSAPFVILADIHRFRCLNAVSRCHTRISSCFAVLYTKLEASVGRSPGRCCASFVISSELDTAGLRQRNSLVGLPRQLLNRLQFAMNATARLVFSVGEYGRVMHSYLARFHHIIPSGFVFCLFVCCLTAHQHYLGYSAKNSWECSKPSAQRRIWHISIKGLEDWLPS